MEPKEAIYSLEKALGIPIGFFWALLKESDWSFLIKLHALVETSLTQMLLGVLDRPELEDFLPRMNLEGGAGKVRLAETLGVLQTEQVKFIRVLTSLRNKVVHNVKNIDFDLERHVKELKNDEFTHLRDALGFSPSATFTYDEKNKDVPVDSLIRSLPKVVFMMTASLCLTKIFFEHDLAARKQALRELGAALRPDPTSDALLRAVVERRRKAEKENKEG